MPTILRSKVLMLAMAIAECEGYFSVLNTISKRANNPGDLEAGDIGHGTIDKKTIYLNADGWQALILQIENMVNGKSKHYYSLMTLSQMGIIYSGDEKYGLMLSQILGVNPTITLGSYLTI